MVGGEHAIQGEELPRYGRETRAVVHLNKFSFITVVTWEAGPRSHFTGQLHVTCYRDIILIGCENAVRPRA